MDLTYTVIDGNGGSIDASRSFTLDAVNDGPTGAATAALAAGTEDTAYTVSAADLLKGFSDVEGDTLSVSGLTSSNSTVTDNGDGTFTITPTLNYNGTVDLTYTVIDGNGGSVAANQSFNLAAVNDAATFSGAVSGTAIEQGKGVSGTSAAGVMTNADVDNTPNTFQVESGTAAHGKWSMGAGGSWSYVPDQSDSAVNGLNVGGSVSDSFTVHSADGTAQLVTVQITGSNDSAVITGTLTGTVHEDWGTAKTSTGTVAVSDVDNNSAYSTVDGTAAIVNGIVHGTYGDLALTGGAWTYTLNNSSAGLNIGSSTVTNGSGNGTDSLTTGHSVADVFHFATTDGTKFDINIKVDGHTEKLFIASGDPETIKGFAAGDAIDLKNINKEYSHNPTETYLNDANGNHVSTVLQFAKANGEHKDIILQNYVDPAGQDLLHNNYNLVG